MPNPFFTGGNRNDDLCGCAVAAAVEYGRPDMARLAWQSIEECTVQPFPGGGGFIPDSLVLVSERYIVVAVQGTVTTPQWLGNVLGSIQQTKAGYPGKVNAYFANVADSILTVVRPFVAPLLPSRSLVCLGHSLGGAICTLIAYRLRAEFDRPTRVVTYGCPRIGDPTFAAAFTSDELTRVENTGDPVTALPPPLWAGLGSAFPIPGPGVPAVYRHAGGSITYDDAGEVISGSPFITITTCAAWLAHGDPVTPHVISQYAWRIRSDMIDAAFYPNTLGYADPNRINDSLEGTLTGSVPAYHFPPLIPADEVEMPAFLGGSSMGVWRATFFFKAVDYGWTESYYQDQADHVLVEAAAKTLAKFRYALMGGGMSMPAVRISDVATFRDFGITPLPYQTGAEDDSASGHAKPYSAILVNLTASQYTNRVYLRGVNQAEIKGDRPLNLTPSFKSDLNKWAVALKEGNWMMRVQARFAPDLVGGNVAGASAATPIVITTAAAHGLLSGDQVFIRGVKGNTAANGTFFVDKLTDTTFSLRGSVATAAYEGDGIWRKKFFIYKVIQKAEPIREVSHRTGRPFDMPVGRRRRKKSA